MLECYRNGNQIPNSIRGSFIFRALNMQIGTSMKKSFFYHNKSINDWLNGFNVKALNNEYYDHASGNLSCRTHGHRGVHMDIALGSSSQSNSNNNNTVQVNKFRNNIQNTS